MLRVVRSSSLPQLTLPVDILCHVSSRSCGSSVTSSKRLAGPGPHRSKDSLVIGDDARDELEPPERDGL
jgi:hypothetical protein